MAKKNGIEFKRGYLSYTPKQLSPYSSTDIISAYIEIYNLAHDSTGWSKYTISTDILPRDSKTIQSNSKILSIHGPDLNKLVNETKVTVQRPLANDIVYVKIKRGDIFSGDFDLVIRLTDDVSGERVERRTELVVR